MKKILLGLFPLLFASSIILFSCKKENLIITDHISDPPPFVPDREYIWGQSWQKTSAGYEMKLPIQRLTDSAINKGIRVGLAIYSDWSNFETLPFTINDPTWLRDTINLSYTATPGKLQVFAKTTVDITWASDVFIQY